MAQGPDIARYPSGISCYVDFRKESAAFLIPLFHYYESKDPGCLFHLKSIIALRAGAPRDEPPLYMYIGSANLSAGAWGKVKPDKRNPPALRLTDIANFECGVVVKGGDIVSMLETGDWQDIIPYKRPSEANVRRVACFCGLQIDLLIPRHWQRYEQWERPYKVYIK